MVRVLDALNRWFRVHGIAPSYREIEREARVPAQRVRSILDKLQSAGYLTHQQGVRRSVVMVDRYANFSDDEFERGARARGATIVWASEVGEAAGCVGR